MKNNYEELKKNYESIYNNTLEIGMLIEKGEIDKIRPILDLKGDLIKKVCKIASEMNFSEAEKLELNDLIAKIKETENKNIHHIENIKITIKKEILNVNINHKMISAYKYKKEFKPRLVDIDDSQD